MDQQQAQQIIKAVLDQAITAGVLKNIEAATTVAQAWAIIKNKLDESANA